VSDHVPLWVELAIDFSDEHLLNNVTEGAMERPAQLEFMQEGEDLSRYHGEAPRLDEPDTDPPPEPEAPEKAKKRKRPKVAAKSKVGTARPNPRLTLREGWHIFWFVATGKADAIRKERRAQEKAAKAKKPRKAK